MNVDRGIDMSVIESLRELGGGDELLTELVELFLCDSPERLRDLERAVRAKDGARVEAIAHSLKSSCANIGAMRLSDMCRRIETAGREATLEAAESLVSLSKEELAAVSRDLNDLV